MSKKKKQARSKDRKKKQAEEKKGFKHWWLVGLVIVLITTTGIYSPISEFSFISYDDDRYIVQNLDIKDFSVSGIKKIFLNPQNPEELKPPMTVFSFAINYYFSEMDPSGYYLTNLGFHLLNVVLVYFLILAVTGNKLAGVFTCAVFALHPSSAEAVAWATSRKEVQYTFFYLAALLAVFRFWKIRNYWFYALALGLFVISFYSKFSAATFPLLYLGLALIWKKRKDFLKVVLEVVPFLILPMYSFVLAVFPSGGGGGSEDGGATVATGEAAAPPTETQFEAMQTITTYESFDFIDKVFLGGYSFVKYLGKYFAPFDLQLLYPYPPLNDGSLPTIYYIATVVAILLMGFVVFYFVRNPKQLSNTPGFALVFFLVHVSILLHLLPIGGRVIVADRYTYLPFIGLSLVLFYALSLLNKRVKGQAIPVVAAAAFLVFLGARLNARIPDWKDSETVMKDLIEKEPGYPVPYNNLGNMYLNSGRFNEAIDLFSKAIALDNQYIEAYNNRGTAYLKLNQYNLALKDLNKASSLAPDYAVAIHNIGKVNQQRGNYQEALKHYKRVLEIDTSFYISEYNIGTIYLNNQELDKAKHHLKRAIGLNPHFATGYNTLGLLFKHGFNDVESALDNFNKAIRIDPHHADALSNKGLALFELNQHGEAIRYFTQAIQANRNQAKAYFGRGLAYQGLNNPSRACNDWRIAMQLGYSDATRMYQRNCN